MALWSDTLARWVRLARAPEFSAYVRESIARLDDEMIGEDDAETIVNSASTRLTDLLVGEAKAFVFGVVAALVASYKGMTAKGGPKGVGDAVNQSVVITFMLLFLVNVVITTIYFQIVPQKGT